MNIFDSWLATKPIAHRGLHDEDAPELSLASFKKAIDNNFAIELDLRALADGTIVVFHDETLGRMTGKDGYLANLKYEDIRDLTLNKSKEHIPTLEKTLSFVDGKTPLLIEIKNMGKVGEFEKAVLKELTGYKGEFAVQSFNPYTLEWFKINAPHIKRGQVASFMKNSNLPFLKRFNLKRMRLNKKVSEPNFIAYKTEDLPNPYVKRFKELPVIAWCVRNDEEYARVKKHCDNIIFEHITPII